MTTTTYYFFLFTVCKFAWRGQLAVRPNFSVQPMLACTQYYDYLLCLVFSRDGMMSASFLHGFWTYCSSDHMIAQKYVHMEHLCGRSTTQALPPLATPFALGAVGDMDLHGRRLKSHRR